MSIVHIPWIDLLCQMSEMFSFSQCRISIRTAWYHRNTVILQCQLRGFLSLCPIHRIDFSPFFIFFTYLSSNVFIQPTSSNDQNSRRGHFIAQDFLYLSITIFWVVSKCSLAHWLSNNGPQPPRGCFRILKASENIDCRTSSPECLTHRVWGAAWECAFAVCSGAMLLLFQDDILRTTVPEQIFLAMDFWKQKMMCSSFLFQKTAIPYWIFGAFALPVSH